MVNALAGDPRVGLLQRALGGLAQRQQALAGNIANVDTPGYRRRDIPFEAELRAGMAAGRGPRMASTTLGHFSVAPAGGLLHTTSETGRTQAGRNDGNDVDIDHEMTRLAETSLRYQLMTVAVSARFTLLRDIAARAV